MSLWAYLLTFLHEVAKQQRPAVNARTKQASMMKVQVRVSERLAALIMPSAIAA